MYMVMEQSFQTRTKIRERGNFVAATVAMSVGHQCLAKFLWILFCFFKVKLSIMLDMGKSLISLYTFDLQCQHTFPQ